MHGLAGKARFVQGVLDDGPIETREGIAVEMGRLAFHLADGEQRVIGLVLEDSLLAAVQPGHVGATDPSTRWDHNQAPVR